MTKASLQQHFRSFLVSLGTVEGQMADNSDEQGECPRALGTPDSVGHLSQAPVKEQLSFTVILEMKEHAVPSSAPNEVTSLSLCSHGCC